MLPSFVFIMYSITVADKSCRAMFYNCDKDLLRYAWYRKPKVILRSFGIRLRRVALYNGLVAGALCLAAVFSPRILPCSVPRFFCSRFCSPRTTCAFTTSSSPIPKA